MSEAPTSIAALLDEAGETHHTVYRIVDGDDPDWASWYADWLVNLSELPQILGITPVRSELVWLLVSLDKQYQEQSPEAPLAGLVRRANRRPLRPASGVARAYWQAPGARLPSVQVACRYGR